MSKKQPKTGTQKKVKKVNKKTMIKKKRTIKKTTSADIALNNLPEEEIDKIPSEVHDISEPDIPA